MTQETVAVLGSGNGGHAAAALLASQGHRVRLYGRHGFHDRLLPIRSAGGIMLSGVAGAGHVGLDAVTNDIEEALDGADIVVVATPATAHDELAKLCAPHLRDAQVVLLLQGMAGSLLFSRALRSRSRPPEVWLGETATLPYTCRLAGPGQVTVTRISRRLLTSSLPGRDATRLVERLLPCFPYLAPARHVLETALYNPNPLLHPAGTLLNLGRIEHVRGNFRIYQEGFTPSVWNVIHAVDREKMMLLRALDLPAMPYLEEFALRNGDTFADFAAIGITGPASARDRYLTEDVPIGLVLFSSLGAALGVSTAVCDALIELASVVNATDYRAIGRTLDRLGLTGHSREEIDHCLVHPHVR